MLLSHYYQRAPRYILLPQDNCFIRVAGPKQTPWEEGTEIQNISQTGLCFSAPDILLPRLGENIRIQFAVPDSNQMACYAKVIRFEKINAENSLVAVEFEAMNSAQKMTLFRGLKGKIKNEEALTLGAPNYVGFNTKHAPRWMMALFFMSVGLSLYLSAYLLFSIYRFLADPHGMEKLVQFFKQISF